MKTNAQLLSELLENTTPTEDCVPWPGYLDDNGYARIYVSGATSARTGLPLRSGKVTAHRLAYEMKVGPIPRGYEVDHLCRNRACLNPAHLEVVSHAENNRRKPSHGLRTPSGQGTVTHCPAGNPRSVHRTPYGSCRPGQAAKRRRYALRQRAAREADTVRVSTEAAA